MCRGFGLIIDKELNLWFTEPDSDGNCSHTTTIERWGWKENGNQHLRAFVRVQFADWQPASFEFDEDETLPGWCENAKAAIQDKRSALLDRCTPAWAEYEKVCTPARAAYEKVCAAAWAEYEKVCAAARAAYQKVRYAAWAIMVAKLATVPGYVPA